MVSSAHRSSLNDSANIAHGEVRQSPTLEVLTAQPQTFNYLVRRPRHSGRRSFWRGLAKCCASDEGHLRLLFCWNGT